MLNIGGVVPFETGLDLAPNEIGIRNKMNSFNGHGFISELDRRLWLRLHRQSQWT